MDWQRIAALVIVAGTAGAFVAARLRRSRKFSFEHDTHCGCGGSGEPVRNSIVFSARKGEQGKIIMKMR